MCKFIIHMEILISVSVGYLYFICVTFIEFLLINSEKEKKQQQKVDFSSTFDSVLTTLQG